MNPESPEAAYIVWGGVFLTNVFVLLYMFGLNKLASARSKDLVKAAAISSGIVHLVLITMEGVGEIMMWFMVSFPLVFVVGIGMNMILKAVVETFVGKERK